MSQPQLSRSVCRSRGPQMRRRKPAQYREEPQDKPVADAADKSKSRVTLIAVSPPEGSEVRADSILDLDVEFHIANFAPEKFLLRVGFPTISGMFSPGNGGKDDFQLLKTPSGKLHLCVPLKEVYEHPGVRWPLSMQVSLYQQFPSHSQIQAESRKAILNSVDVPAGALEQQTAAPPEDVQYAVMMVFGRIDMHGALNKVCPARFPDMQTKFVKTYRAWGKRAMPQTSSRSRSRSTRSSEPRMRSPTAIRPWRSMAVALRR